MPSISSHHSVTSRSTCRRGSRTTSTTMLLNPPQRRRRNVRASSKLPYEFTKSVGKSDNSKLHTIAHSSNSSRSNFNVQQTSDQQHISSKAIPLPKAHIRRTLSEENMKEGTAIAELHDAHMFKRLVHGIEEQAKTSSARTSGSTCISTDQHHPSVHEYLAGVRNSKTIDNIVRSRNASFTELDNLSSSCAFAADESKGISSVRTRTCHANDESSSLQCAVLQDVLKMACEISLETPPSPDSPDPKQHCPEEGIFIMDDL